MTHDQTEALNLSDRIVVMNGGRIAQIGTPRDIYDAPSDVFVADFVGSTNLLDAELIERRKTSRRIRLNGGTILGYDVVPGRSTHTGAAFNAFGLRRRERCHVALGT